MNHLLQRLVLCTALASSGLCTAQSSSPGMAPGTAKDIVLDRVSAPLLGASTRSANDAMVVSLLLESPDGSLVPSSTERVFNTGERFRVKLLTSRTGQVSFYNTKPNGVTSPEPVWRGEVKVGLETISPRLVLDGASGAGTEQLHVLLEPAEEPGVFAWLGRWLGGPMGRSKDIRLDQQSTPQATYLMTDSGKGIVTTVRIAHR
jgi:hypothetical protein